jgi:hypothetical protein
MGGKLIESAINGMLWRRKRRATAPSDNTKKGVVAHRKHQSPSETCRRATAEGKLVFQAFLISIFCCFFATSAGFGKWTRKTPLSNFASTLAGSGSNGKGIILLNEP